MTSAADTTTSTSSASDTSTSSDTSSIMPTMPSNQDGVLSLVIGAIISLAILFAIVWVVSFAWHSASK